MEELPDCMQICYLTMFNSGNDLAYDVLKNLGLNILSGIKKVESFRICFLEDIFINGA